MKNNRPVNLSLAQVLAVNMRSPVAMASIMHRLSGVLVFILIPALLYMAQLSLESEAGFINMKEIFASLPVRLLVWVGLSGLLFHLFAGIKHLLADIGVAEGLQSGRVAAWLAIASSAISIVLAFVWVVL